MSLFESSGTNTLFIAADSVSDGLLLVKYPTSSSPISYIYEESKKYRLVAMDIEASSASDALVLIMNRRRSMFEVLTVTYASSGQIGIKRKILTQPVFAMSEVIYAKIMQTGEYFISGQVSSFGNSVKSCMTGSNLKGFILSSSS